MTTGLIVIAVFVVGFVGIILWKRRKKSNNKKMGGGSGGSRKEKPTGESTYSK